MPLATNATMTFTSYEPTDSGIEMTFLCPDPGPGMQSEWRIFVTDDELAGVTSLATFSALVLAKLKRKFRNDGIATKLDSMIGRSVTLP